MMMRFALALFIVGALMLMPVIAGGVNRTDSQQDAAIDRLNCEVFAEDCATPEPHTATPERSPTVTPSATSTPTPALSGWHAATNHEHGDAPPAWVQAWSMAQFGHGVVYGGDESTPGENLMKHEAYKGFVLSVNGVEVYLRHHTQTNPHGRAARYHSYEIYARDTTGAVSFWQGWLDFGNVPERRFSYTTTQLADINGTEPGTAFILSYARDTTRSDYLGRETWYARNDAAEWSWTVEITYYDPSVWFAIGEHTGDIINPATWDATGAYGLDRLVRLRWNIPGSYATLPNRNAANPRGWFCAEATGAIVAMGVSGPAACPSGSLPQYISPSMQPNGAGIVARRTFPCPSCRLAN